MAIDGLSRRPNGILLTDDENEADVRVSIAHLRAANRYYYIDLGPVWKKVYEWCKPFTACYISAVWMWQDIRIYSTFGGLPSNIHTDRSGRWSRRSAASDAARRARSDERRDRLQLLGMLV